MSNAVINLEAEFVKNFEAFLSRSKVLATSATVTTLCLIFLSIALQQPGFAQQIVNQPKNESPKTISDLPGYDKYQAAKRVQKIHRKSGRIKNVRWAKDGSCVVFTDGKKRRQLNFNTKKIIPGTNIATVGSLGQVKTTDEEKRPPVPRAQQRRSERSPDGSMTAIYKDFNVWIRDLRFAGEKQITTGGSDRVRYGTGCWVYGEELEQDTAMWWSPDSRKLAFYEVDERAMKDYVLTLDNTKPYTRTQAVRYPKAGDHNPRIGLLIYDLDSKKIQRISITDQSAEYIFNVRFSPLGDTLLFNQSNRDQNRLNVMAADVQTGQTRVVLSETESTWQEPNPAMRVLNKGKTFVWETERTGWKNFELRNFDGQLIRPLSEFANFPCEKIEQIDESAGLMYYSAFSDANPYNRQLHRCRLDGTEKVRITTASLNHDNFLISPDHRWVIATAERFDQPRRTVIYSADKSDARVSKFANGVEISTRPQPTTASKHNEILQFLSADGTTTLFGTLQKPTNFDPNKKYPLLIDVYGGPQSVGIFNKFAATNPICEFGFLIAKIGNRGTINRGKAFESATYQRFGGPDLDDQVEGVMHLSKRPYIDSDRVGIFGHSYGGYLTTLAVLKRPDIFRVGVAGSPVTDWRNYDTIYTERHMRTPAENPDGYRSSSCLTYAKKLQGNLLLVHGLIDDNVHPANTWQLIEALQSNDQRFDLMIYPKSKHGIDSTYPKLRIEYFHRHLMRN